MTRFSLDELQPYSEWIAVALSLLIVLVVLLLTALWPG